MTVKPTYEELAQRIQTLENQAAGRKKAEEALRESEEKYRILLDESSDPIFSFYPDGTYRYVNRAFAEGVGKPVDDIIGHRIWDVFSREEADKRFAVVKTVFETGETRVIDVRVPLPDGDQYYITTVKPVKDPRGEVLSVICSSKKITERKRAEKALREERDKLQAALAKIKTLSGLIPICASCKKIRDDQGYWNQIEAYLQRHSEIAFSHGICPECAKRLYPGLTRHGG